jgi:hypothetical protein
MILCPLDFFSLNDAGELLIISLRKKRYSKPCLENPDSRPHTQDRLKTLAPKNYMTT